MTDIGVAVGTVAAATTLTYFAPRAHGPKVPFAQFVFLLAILASGARSYLAGILSCLLSFFVVPFLFNPSFNPASVDPVRFGMTLMIAVLISATMANRRRAERTLRATNEDLDRRVQERTSALETANRELAHREEELNQTKAHLNDVLDSVSESFLALDRDWRFTYVNKRILTTLDAGVQDVVGRVIWDVFPAAAKSAFYPEYHRVMRDRVPARFEVEYHETGRWFEVAAHPTLQGLSAYVADITERKRDEAAIGRLASIVESSSDAIVSKDLQG
ncbi:MAG: PAS domain-containing protein, partial [Acidobacteriota bacterium]|nr:PAS domain-containing protein [Acidobacteriota bacterium]